MKFGKELASQMVAEWQGAYMHDNNLKKLLKNILRFRQQNTFVGEFGTFSVWQKENEHLNNVKKYRTFKHVPLPFHYADEKIV